MNKTRNYPYNNQQKFQKREKIFICDKKVECINNTDLVNYINSKIHYYFKCSQYDHITNDHLNLLNKSPYYGSLKSSGKQYYLFMTKYLRTKYCFLISREWNPVIYSIKLRFGNNVLTDTLIEGELVKDNNGVWLFLASDLYLNCGSKCNGTYVERINDLYKLLSTCYKKDRCLDIFSIQVKKLIKYQDLRYLEKFIQTLDYTIKGINFIPNSTLVSKHKFIYVSIDKFTINETKEVSNSVEKSEKNKFNKKQKTYLSDSESSNSSIISDTKSDVESEVSDDDVNRQPELLKKQEYNICFANLLIKTTGKPDVYEVYTSDKTNNFIGYACLNTLKTSKLISSLFSEQKNPNGVIMKCRFHTRFKKWIPEEISTDKTIHSREEVNSFEESVK
jgi:hypothetical protein